MTSSQHCDFLAPATDSGDSGNGQALFFKIRNTLLAMNQHEEKSGRGLVERQKGRGTVFGLMEVKKKNTLLTSFPVTDGHRKLLRCCLVSFWLDEDLLVLVLLVFAGAQCGYLLDGAVWDGMFRAGGSWRRGGALAGPSRSTCGGQWTALPRRTPAC